MRQNVSKKIKETYKDLVDPVIYTLLVDGHNLLKLSMSNPKVNNEGVHVGGIIQFMTIIRMMLLRKDFDYVYVFWDGDNSGQLRYEIYNDYKANRNKNYYGSEYEREINERMKVCCSLGKKKKSAESEREEFEREKIIIQNMLENLFVRQLSVDYIESDDLIAYYTNNKNNNEKIVIMSNDMDLSQLLSPDVCIYSTSIKNFITVDNYSSITGIHYENVLLKKVICGDASDNIKGIKGVGEDTLIKLIPEIKTRKVTLDDVISRARESISERVNNKKKPLKYTENIVNKVTDGIQGDKVYEINKRIIDLKHPMLNDEALSSIDELRYNVIDPNERTFDNLYNIIRDNNIMDFIDPSKFSSFFASFSRIISKEKKRVS